MFAISALVLYFSLYYYSAIKLKTDIMSRAAFGRIIIGGRIKQVNISSFLFIILKFAGARVQYDSAPPFYYVFHEPFVIIVSGAVIIILIIVAILIIRRLRKSKTKVN